MIRIFIIAVEYWDHYRNKLTGQYHWYQVKFFYKDGDRIVFDVEQQVGYRHRGSILDLRYVKKTIEPLHRKKGIPKPLLNNGTFHVNIVCYLGRLSAKPNKGLL